jgi:hypothetical protein
MGTLEGFPNPGILRGQQWTDQSDGRTLPSFVTGELHDFLGCGIFGTT